MLGSADFPPLACSRSSLSACWRRVRATHLARVSHSWRIRMTRLRPIVLALFLALSLPAAALAQAVPPIVVGRVLTIDECIAIARGPAVDPGHALRLRGRARAGA